jgi:predicted DNA-binding transcriptional regulator YafY
MLKEEDGIWLGEEKKEIVLKISSEIAGYFMRRKLIANQVIEKELEDGGLIVSAKVGHVNQVLPIVRYWIPHIRIISPEVLQAEVEQELREYLERSGC